MRSSFSVAAMRLGDTPEAYMVKMRRTTSASSSTMARSPRKGVPSGAIPAETGR